ncbi:MAG: hypothetical protein J6S67_11245 [Methanobrevibacter sp.]|nr:hypothetical protein [Methanobrevibacter sp.]
MVEVADLKAKVKVDGHSALTVLDKLNDKLEKIAYKLDTMEDTFQVVAKRGSEAMGFLGHSISFAFGGAIKDSIQWFGKKIKEVWEDAEQLSLNLEKMKFGTGIDILPLQRMKAILEQNNISFEEMLGAIGKMQDLIARRRYGKLSEDELFAFGRLGINPAEYNNAQKLLEAIGRSLNKIKNINDRNFLASKLKLSPEVLRGLTASGWYDEFAALTDAEQQKMLEYAKNSKAISQEIGATWTKFISKFVTGDGIKLQEWILDALGGFNKIVSESDSMGEAFDRLGEKIAEVFDFDIEDTKFIKGLKFAAHIAYGAGKEGIKELVERPIGTAAMFWKYLTDKDVSWQDVEDFANSSLDDDMPLSPRTNSFSGSRSLSQTNYVNMIFNTSGDVDGNSLKDYMETDFGTNIASYLLPQE